MGDGIGARDEMEENGRSQSAFEHGTFHCKSRRLSQLHTRHWCQRVSAVTVLPDF